MEVDQQGTGTERSVSTGPSDGASHIENVGSPTNTGSAPPVEESGTNDLASYISMASDSDSDSNSDESESDKSDSAEPTTEPEPHPASNGIENLQHGMDMDSRKRKTPGGDSEDSETGESSTSAPHKRIRLDNISQQSPVSNGLVTDKALLAPEVWHHIFTFCPPKTLGNLLRVNKLFHQYLNPSSSAQIDFPPSASRGLLSVLDPTKVWHLSRRLFWPHMPAPLRSMSGLDMWRLLCSTKCQECNKSEIHDAKLPADNLHNGPGEGGVTVIWPFGIRVCGPCLLKKAVKEIDVLLSSTVPSTLIPALPFVYITKELHVVSPSTIEHGQLPANIQVTKLFLAEDVQDIKKEFISVKALGSGTVEEWLKGLEPRGQARLSESRKWEKWANSGSLQQVRNVTDPYMLNRPATVPIMAIPASPTGQNQSVPGNRQERTLERVSELKAARKAEIERRASLFTPPLMPEVLRHMVSFQAATQLISELDDNAWELLRPRLLAEKSDAEEIERKVSAQIQMIRGHNNNSHLEATLATTKEAKDAIDRNWEEVQAPLRARIVKYADEIIRNGWDQGEKVNKDNCAKFAAEALIHIRKRFYAQVAKDAEKAKAAGQESVKDRPEGPFTRKLTLENMRWIFDTKIKPLTAPFKKEVFYCNGCAGKPFGFEGVVQHYAAKHTDALSFGNIVVHWRTEWPEVPPFNPEGRSKVTAPVPGATAHPATTGALPAYPFNSYAPPPGPAVPPPGQPFAPGPSYGTPQFGEQQYGYQYPGYTPTPGYTPPAPGVQPPPFATQPGWGPYQNGPTPIGPYPPNLPPPQAMAYQQPMAPAPGPAPSLPGVPGPYTYGPGGYPTNGGGGFAAAQAPYSVKLDDIVRNSRETWNATANIRDLPGSARVFVTIYHVVKRFRARFSETPPLAIFQDGLSNHKDMRPVRNINTLTCKACQLGLGNAPYVQEDRKSFSLPQLVNHFQSKHIEAMQNQAPNSPPLDWTSDMILVPGPAILSKLRGAVSNDGLKYRLFSEAFPEVFGPVAPPPVTDYYAQHQQHQSTFLQQQQQQSQYPTAAPPPPVDNHEGFYGQQQGPTQAQAHQVHAAPTPYQPQPGYSQPPATNAYAAPASQAPQYQPEPAPPNPAVASIAEYDAPRREENSSRPLQGSRPQNQQNPKWAKKNKNKQGQSGQIGHNGQNKQHSGPGPRIKEEEPKVPEDEKAREEEMRAMWANDRAATAQAFRASVIKPESQRAGQNQPKVKQEQPQVTTQGRRDKRQDFRGPPPKRVDHPPQEKRSLLDALEMHLDQEPRSATQGQQPRGQPGAVHINGLQPRATVAPEANRRPTEQYPEPIYQTARPVSPAAPYAQHAREDYPHQRAPDQRHYGGTHPQDPAPRPGPGPDDYRYGPPDHAALQGQRQEQPPPPVRRPEPHQPQQYDHGYRPDDQPMFDRPPPQEFRPLPTYEDALPPPPRGPPTGQLYEIVEVIDAQGSYFIRRPIGRAPPAPEYYDYPYEPEPQRPRERQPPVDPYELEPQQPHERQPPIGAARGGQEPYSARPVGDDGYARPHPPPQQQGEEYPLPASRNWGSEYRPTPPPQQYQRPSERGEGPARRVARQVEDEDEYDPRYPAAPPPPPTNLVDGYQRRQVRYDD